MRLDMRNSSVIAWEADERHSVNSYDLPLFSMMRFGKESPNRFRRMSQNSINELSLCFSFFTVNEQIRPSESTFGHKRERKLPQETRKLLSILHLATVLLLCSRAALFWHRNSFQCHTFFLCNLQASSSHAQIHGEDFMFKTRRRH